MPFNGFTRGTLDYFLSMKFDNSKTNFETNKQLYIDCVRDPLRGLFAELVPAMLAIDGSICVKQSRCVSGAYNDARFSRAEPVKCYMYLHFCAQTPCYEDGNVPGFFMDASHDGYRYGLQLYRQTTSGMKAIRDAAYNDQKNFMKIAKAIEKNNFSLEGGDYKTDRYPDAIPEIKNWLNKKTWWIGKTRDIDEIFLSNKFVCELAENFKALAPLYKFILRCGFYDYVI